MEGAAMTIYELFDETEDDRVYTCGLYRQGSEALAAASIEPSEEAIGVGCIHYTIRRREVGRFEHGVTGDRVMDVVWGYDYNRDVWVKTERSWE